MRAVWVASGQRPAIMADGIAGVATCPLRPIGADWLYRETLHGSGQAEMKWSTLAIAAGLLVSIDISAQAQISPFRNNRTGQRLSATDMDLLNDSVSSLNQQPNLAVGASKDWNNPATGSHGVTTVSRIFTDHGRPCHAMHHEVFAENATQARGYDLTWCRVAAGNWRIKS
jgi:hypothetical protein